MNELEQLMAEYGFYLTETGGGCTAFIRVEGCGAFEAITRHRDVEAPTSYFEPCELGRYTADGSLLSLTSLTLATVIHGDRGTHG